MDRRIGLTLLVGVGCILTFLAFHRTDACCPAPPQGRGQAVVNADQTVIVIWDAKKKLQHFIRKASFRSEADDFGFIIPSPTRPELAESSNDSFDVFQRATAPEIKWVEIPEPLGGADKRDAAKGDVKKEYVKVLEQKLVAGFNASVLETISSAALVKWLKDNDYAFSPEIEEWAKPYIKMRWILTALKVAPKQKDKETKVASVSAPALRMSFATDRPLFPYREPDYRSAANSLKDRRLLRIYFVAEARYKAEIGDAPLGAKVAWSGTLTDADRQQALALLKVPGDSGPDAWWLTEFEHNWPYDLASADVYFARDENQATVRRPPVTRYRYALPAPGNEHPADDLVVGFPWLSGAVVVAVAGGVGIFLITVVLVLFLWMRRKSV